MDRTSGGAHGRAADIDLLRGLAILAVLLLHAGLMTPGIETMPRLLPLVQRLSTGVQMFFVVSGFLICASWDRGLANGEGAGQFLVRRAAKIVPLYLVFLHINIAFYLTAAQLAPAVPPFRNSVSTDSLTIGNYLLHLSFLQGMVPAAMHTLVDGSWSIVIEVYFYLLFPLVLARRTVRPPDCVAAYALSLAVAILFVVLVGRRFSGLSHYGFPAQLPCFMLGVLAYRIAALPDFQRLFAPWRPALAACCLLLMLGLVKGDSKPLGDSIVYAICFAGLLLCAPTVAAAFPAAARRVLASMGRQSYALFFVHLALLKAAYVLVQANDLELTFGAALGLNLLVAVPLSWLASSLVFDPIDRYFVALAARRLARNTQNPPHWSPA